MPAVGVSSLILLFQGDSDSAPVFNPNLVAEICESLDESRLSSKLALAKLIYPGLPNVAAMSDGDLAKLIAHEYGDDLEVGGRAATAIGMGYHRWRGRNRK